MRNRWRLKTSTCPRFYPQSMYTQAYRVTLKLPTPQISGRLSTDVAPLCAHSSIGDERIHLQSNLQLTSTPHKRTSSPNSRYSSSPHKDIYRLRGKRTQQQHAPRTATTGATAPVQEAHKHNHHNAHNHKQLSTHYASPSEPPCTYYAQPRTPPLQTTHSTLHRPRTPPCADHTQQRTSRTHNHARYSPTTKHTTSHSLANTAPYSSHVHALSSLEQSTRKSQE